MIKGKTKSGFEYEISKDVVNDYELLENLAELETNPLILTTVIKQVLGVEQAEKLKDHVRNNRGTVPIDKITNEILDIFTNSGEEIKNF
jgi:DNA integrity scanning protein DisA with diadenylate cyclase activity